MDIEKAINELKRSIEMPFASEIINETSKMAIEALEELQRYRYVGTVDECRSAMEKQTPKEPKRVHIKYGKHKWKRTESGEIDECAWDYGNHNGVHCEVCGRDVCVLCNPNYDELEDCEEEYFLCPNCGKKHYTKPLYCECGQALKWGD